MAAAAEVVSDLVPYGAFHIFFGGLATPLPAPWVYVKTPHERLTEERRNREAPRPANDGGEKVLARDELVDKPETIYVALGELDEQSEPLRKAETQPSTPAEDGTHKGHSVTDSGGWFAPLSAVGGVQRTAFDIDNLNAGEHDFAMVLPLLNGPSPLMVHFSTAHDNTDNYKAVMDWAKANLVKVKHRLAW